MDDATLMYAALLALTQQNVIYASNAPIDVTIGSINCVYTLEFWVGDIIVDTFTAV